VKCSYASDNSSIEMKMREEQWCNYTARGRGGDKMFGEIYTDIYINNQLVPHREKTVSVMKRTS